MQSTCIGRTKAPVSFGSFIARLVKATCTNRTDKIPGQIPEQFNRDYRTKSSGIHSGILVNLPWNFFVLEFWLNCPFGNPNNLQERQLSRRHINEEYSRLLAFFVFRAQRKEKKSSKDHIVKREENCLRHRTYTEINMSFICFHFAVCC